MRVQLTAKGPRTARSGSTKRTERGAVAVLAATLAVLLALMAGFAVDFGFAYNSKRQLQTAADAAALRAAAVYSQKSGTCSQLKTNADYEAEAQAAADAIADENRPGQQPEDIEISCPATGSLAGSLEVKFSTGASTKTIFGGIAGVDEVPASRSAKAAVTVSPRTTTALRPMAICSAALPLGALPGQAFRSYSPGDGQSKAPSCPLPSNPGNWWTVDCPEERTGSTSQLEDQILEGCDMGAAIIPTSGTPGEVTNQLDTACAGGASAGDDNCFSGDPGQPDSGQIRASWKKLIDDQTRIVLPVFCAPPQCTSSTIDGTGTNATFPVYRLVGAVVCGYHFGQQSQFRYTRTFAASDPCAGWSMPSEPALPDDSRDVSYIDFRFVYLQTSGGMDDAPCGLAGGCDGGLRRLLLTE